MCVCVAELCFLWRNFARAGRVREKKEASRGGGTSCAFRPVAGGRAFAKVRAFLLATPSHPFALWSGAWWTQRPRCYRFSCASHLHSVSPAQPFGPLTASLWLLVVRSMQQSVLLCAGGGSHLGAEGANRGPLASKGLLVWASVCSISSCMARAGVVRGSRQSSQHTGKKSEAGTGV